MYLRGASCPPPTFISAIGFVRRDSEASGVVMARSLLVVLALCSAVTLLALAWFGNWYVTAARLGGTGPAAGEHAVASAQESEPLYPPAAQEEEESESLARKVRFSETVRVHEYGRDEAPMARGPPPAMAPSPGFAGPARGPGPDLAPGQVVDRTHGANGVKYDVVTARTCSAMAQHTLGDTVLAACDAYCSHDGECLAFNYDFDSGACVTFTGCPALEQASAGSQLFVRAGPTRV
jgi:hypothetical protein